MAIFNRSSKAMISSAPEEPSIRAAAGSGYFAGESGNIGSNFVGNFYSYSDGALRQNMMSVPTVARSRDLLASVIASTPLCMYKEQWNGEEMEEVPLAPRAWLDQPDPQLSYATFMSWLLDDLFFFGKAILFINSRTADGYPNSVQRLPAAMVNFRDQAGPVFFSPSQEVYFQGGRIDPENLVQFISPIQGVIYQSEQAVQTAIRLEKARYRNAASTMPTGVLKVVGGEPLTSEELSTLAAQFNSARENNQTAALSQDLDYTETTANPANMLLMEASNYQALEMVRICNVPAYLCGIDLGAYQYTSGKQAREDLYLFGARVYMDCIAQVLSATMLPRGVKVKFDIDDYLADIVATPDTIKESISLNQLPDQDMDQADLLPTPTTGAPNA